MNRAIGITILALASGCAWLTGSACAPASESVMESAPADGIPKVEAAASIAFTEGPTVYKDGSVFFTDTRSHRIMRAMPDGELVVFRENSNRANGLVFDDQWRLIACEGSNAQLDNPRLTRTNLETGKIEVIAESFRDKRLSQPNDVTFDSQGRLYFTDRPRRDPAPDQTNVDAVYRIDTDGSIHQILKAPDIDKPNGLVISPDDKTFYLIEAHPDANRARMIRAYDLQPDGTVTNMRVFHDFYPGRSGDGMTIDSEGNLYVAAGLHRLRKTSETLDTKCGVHIFAPDGELIQFVPIPEDIITNCAFGGPDMKTLYVTAGKTLFKFNTEIKGTRR